MQRCPRWHTWKPSVGDCNPRKTGACVRVGVGMCGTVYEYLFYRRVHKKHTEASDRWTFESHWCLSGSGTTSVHVTSEWQSSTTYVALAGACTSPYTQTYRHTSTLKTIFVWFLCVWVCFPVNPPHTPNIPPPPHTWKTDISFLWPLCWCRFELLKQMWNNLTKPLQVGA